MVGKLDVVTTLGALPFCKVITGQFYFLPFEQLGEMLSKEGNVDGINVLEIIIARFITWCEFTVNIVVVERETLCAHPLLFQCHAEFLAECGLSAG